MSGIRNWVGMQIGFVSFLDEGVGPVLDTLQERGRVNALLPSVLSWSRGNAGRATDWFPDHGRAEPDDLVGGAMFRPRQHYYLNTTLKDFTARDPLYAGKDYLEMILPETQRRGIKVYPYYCETAGTDHRPVQQPGFIHVMEIDAHGRRGSRPCLSNPNYRAWWTAVLEDLVNSYPVDGFVWGIERRGPVLNVLEGDQSSCFCPHCREEAHRRGIDLEAARQGFLALERYVELSREGYRGDGALVEFIRVLFQHPALLQWERMWVEQHQAMYKEIYSTVKWFDPNLQVGMHIWQMINTYNPFMKAEYPLTDLKGCADFVKPVLYHDAAGFRFNKIVKAWSQTWLGDFTPAEATRFLYRILQLDESEWAELPRTGFSPGYVFAETARTVRAVGPDVAVYPGLGVGVQGTGGAENKQITQESIRAAIRASYEAGAQGICLSRNYSEATLTNLAAVGEALDEMGIGEFIPEGISKVKVEARSKGAHESADKVF